MSKARSHKELVEKVKEVIAEAGPLSARGISQYIIEHDMSSKAFNITPKRVARVLRLLVGRGDVIPIDMIDGGKITVYDLQYRDEIYYLPLTRESGKFISEVLFRTASFLLDHDSDVLAAEILLVREWVDSHRKAFNKLVYGEESG